MADSHPSVSASTPTLAPPSSEGSPWAAPGTPAPSGPAAPPAPGLAPPDAAPAAAAAPDAPPAPSPALPLLPPASGLAAASVPPPAPAMSAPPANPATVPGLPVAGSPELPGTYPPAGMSPAGPIAPGTPLAPLVPVDEPDERKRRGAWVVLVALLVVIASGVGALVMLGGTSDERAADVDELPGDDLTVVERDGETYSLQAAAQGTVSAVTVEYEMSMTMSSFGSTRMTGAIDNAAQLMTFSVDDTSGLFGEAGDTDIVFDMGNGRMYMSNTGDFGLGIDEPWLGFDMYAFAEFAGISVEEMQSELAVNPLDVAELFTGADQVVDVGPDTVNGEPVRHYKVTVDVRAAVEANPSWGEFTAEDEEFLREIGDELVYDVWVTEDNQLRKTSFSMNAFGEQLVVEMAVTAVGSDVVIVVPSPDEVYDFDDFLGL